MGAIEQAAVEVEAEVTVIGRHLDFLNFFYQSLAAAAVGDEGGDGADAELMFLGKGAEVREACHGAVWVHDLDDDTGGMETGEAGEIDSGLGVAGAAENAAGFSHERIDVTGLNKVLGYGTGVGK